MRSNAAQQILVLGAIGALAAFDLTVPTLAAEQKHTTPAAPSKPIDFDRDIQPILSQKCIQCHGLSKSSGGLRFTDRQAALAELKSGGRAIVPGKPEEGELLKRITAQDPSERMPPKGEPLTPGQVKLFRHWIAAGADWPMHWAYRPLQRPAVPLPSRESWARTPIDRFILEKLAERGLRPSAEADKRTLLRRVSFDLTGLPPTGTERDAFLADNSPDAYERLVDRLLANPHYGERWARHWMDVVHYAETHGHDQDRPRPNAWPYRDYLIRSFNEDKRYARFVQEQLAGDVLFHEDPDAVVAMGLLATGPWDESSLRDIREDTLDREIARYLDRDDMVTTAMSTFVSTTVHCARCHDHKFDPVSQKEYYSLQAVFAGVDKAERAYDTDPQTAATRRTLWEKIARLPKLREQRDASLLDAGVQAEVARWEKGTAAASAQWAVLEPDSVVSAKGSKLVRQMDGSILSTGDRPDIDTYTIVAPTDLKKITGIRLELLTDESLPHKGPGRQDNGNLHLNEIQVLAAPKARPGDARAMSLHSPRADFNQEGWGVEKAVDGQPQSAWGIFPEVGKPHRAVFAFKEPVGFDGGTILTFRLEQMHGRGHLIGRFRLAVTTAPAPLPLEAGVLPAAIARILSIAPDRRSDAERVDLAAHVLAQRIDQELAGLPLPQLVYSATNSFKPDGSFKPAAGPRPIHLLNRGEITKPGILVGPGSLSCVPGLAGEFKLPGGATEGERRVALARWLTDPRNVLTWRSIVNRIWHYHFGRGLVNTPNDFGRMGGSPTHRELLDWLAATFQESGGSLKRLHRLVVTSAVYRQAAQHDARSAEIDVDNHYLWRMNRTRLDAESMRDAVLQVTGKLDPTMGGPSVKQFIQKPGVHVTPVVDYDSFDVDHPANYRRSVYRFIFRTLPDPFMDALDCADSSQLTPVRNATVTALQALAMLNNKFMVRQAEHLAARAVLAGPELPTQVKEVYELALGRAPTAMETQACVDYASRHGLANLCRVILNSNEFMFVN